MRQKEKPSCCQRVSTLGQQSPSDDSFFPFHTQMPFVPPLCHLQKPFPKDRSCCRRLHFLASQRRRVDHHLDGHRRFGNCKWR